MLEVRRSPKENRRLDAIYVTYDGLMEPLGHSQVRPYLCGLANADVRLALVSFEKPSDLADERKTRFASSFLEEHGILWTPLTYHRRPRALATAWDMVRGASAVLRLWRLHRPTVVHARSYVAGLMALPAKLFFDARFVFDMRGFWPEERVELGLFRAHSFLHWLSKCAERILLERSDQVVVLTESAKTILREREAQERLNNPRTLEKRISVVPCCADTEVFQPRPPDRALAADHGLSASLLIGNVGSVNKRYMLSEMFRFAFHLKTHRPEIRFLYLTRQDSTEVLAAARGAGLRDEDVLVLPVDPLEVPRWLSLFRLGVFFLRPSYAAKASSFTKLGEFLAAGVPVVTNTGIGDVDRILGAERCGLLLHGLTDRDLATAARNALPLLEGEGVPEELSRNCRATATAQFSLDEGVRRYLAIYDSLGSDLRAKAPIAAEVG